MPQIRIVNDPHDAPAVLSEENALGDMLIQPVAPPEPESDLTPAEERYLGFRDTADTGPQLGGHQEPGYEPMQPMSEIQQERQHRPLPHLMPRQGGITERLGEVCVFTGWPRRHATVGKHCPHGMLETMEQRGQD